MRLYFKVFTAALLCFTVMIGTGLYTYVQSEPSGVLQEAYQPAEDFRKSEEVTEADRLDLDIMTSKSRRLNVLLMGSDGGRSDTMMLVSFDPERKLLDIVSVPRDTYNKLPGHEGLGSEKINAVYGFKGAEGGPEGVARQIEKLLQVPVHYYVNVDYQGVREVVDILGGIDVDVPVRMLYDDPYAEPPLHIDLKAGNQTLDGDEAIQFLRWRKNNGGEQQGDLQRIERQHAFVKTAMKKAVSLKLPQVIKASFKNLKTDMTVDKMLIHAVAAVGMDMSKLQSYMIPGEVSMVNNLSCYIHDREGTEAMMLGIYNRTGEEMPDTGTDASAQETSEMF